MQSKNNAPSAAQKRWREAVRELDGGGLEIHHPVGVTAKHNKVHIGHWWVIAVDPQAHKDIHAGKFGKARKAVEKSIFANVLDALKGHADYPPIEVTNAIMNYQR